MQRSFLKNVGVIPESCVVTPGPRFSLFAQRSQPKCKICKNLGSIAINLGKKLDAKCIQGRATHKDIADFDASVPYYLNEAPEAHLPANGHPIRNFFMLISFAWLALSILWNQWEIKAKRSYSTYPDSTAVLEESRTREDTPRDEVDTKLPEICRAEKESFDRIEPGAHKAFLTGMFQFAWQSLSLPVRAVDYMLLGPATYLSPGTGSEAQQNLQQDAAEGQGVRQETMQTIPEKGIPQGLAAMEMSRPEALENDWEASSMQEEMKNYFSYMDPQNPDISLAQNYLRAEERVQIPGGSLAVICTVAIASWLLAYGLCSLLPPEISGMRLREGAVKAEAVGPARTRTNALQPLSSGSTPEPATQYPPVLSMPLPTISELGGDLNSVLAEARLLTATAVLSSWVEQLVSKRLSSCQASVSSLEQCLGEEPEHTLWAAAGSSPGLSVISRARDSFLRLKAYFEAEQVMQRENLEALRGLELSARERAASMASLSAAVRDAEDEVERVLAARLQAQTSPSLGALQWSVEVVGSEQHDFLATWMHMMLLHMLVQSLESTEQVFRTAEREVLLSREAAQAVTNLMQRQQQVLRTIPRTAAKEIPSKQSSSTGSAIAGSKVPVTRPAFFHGYVPRNAVQEGFLETQDLTDLVDVKKQAKQREAVEFLKMGAAAQLRKKREQEKKEENEGSSEVLSSTSKENEVSAFDNQDHAKQQAEQPGLQQAPAGDIFKPVLLPIDEVDFKRPLRLSEGSSSENEQSSVPVQSGLWSLNMADEMEGKKIHGSQKEGLQASVHPDDTKKSATPDGPESQSSK